MLGKALLALGRPQATPPQASVASLLDSMCGGLARPREEVEERRLALSSYVDGLRILGIQVSPKRSHTMQTQ
jgi:hypothetical protein